MLTGFLKDNIDGINMPQFQLDYICDTTNPLHKNLVKLFSDVHCIWWGNQ